MRSVKKKRGQRPEQRNSSCEYKSTLVISTLTHSPKDFIIITNISQSILWYFLQFEQPAIYLPVLLPAYSWSIYSFRFNVKRFKSTGEIRISLLINLNYKLKYKRLKFNCASPGLFWRKWDSLSLCSHWNLEFERRALVVLVRAINFLWRSNCWKFTAWVVITTFITIIWILKRDK